MIINGGEVLSTTAGPGNGGDVVIMADNLSLTAGGSITVGSTDTGDAGSIRITVADTFRSEQSSIATESARANGGDITLKAPKVFLIDSTVTAEAMGLEQGTSHGGNIIVQGEQVVFNRSRIQANAFGGSGGNIRIDATEVYLASPDTILDASSELGLSGTVEIASPVVDFGGAVTPLTSTFDAAATLLSNHCAVRLREERRASFIVQGRDRITVRPEGLLPSPPMPLRFP
jgi:large exoprotein involved in heme utilization and adhesion